MDQYLNLIDFDNGIVNKGTWSRIQKVFKKASDKESITVGFLGGSITQGCLSSTPETCYAYLVYEWWKNKFPDTNVTYVNAGIGATTSQFAIARLEEDLLRFKPDFTTVEFSVNDENNDFFKETYEGLIRKIVKEDTLAPLIIHNCFYDTGVSAEAIHLEIGKHYDIPCVSMKNSVYPRIKDGTISDLKELTEDNLHPNDNGHRLLANLVINLLEKIYEDFLHNNKVIEEDIKSIPDPITLNKYENSIRFRNNNSNPVCNGFIKDSSLQNNITDIFKIGWIGDKDGAKISFKVTGSNIAIQYRKSVKHPACIAKAIIDGDYDNAVMLDANFDEDWGDCLFLQTIMHHGDNAMHTVDIVVTEARKDYVPFYLVSVIQA